MGWTGTRWIEGGEAEEDEGSDERGMMEEKGEQIKGRRSELECVGGLCWWKTKSEREREREKEDFWLTSSRTKIVKPCRAMMMMIGLRLVSV
jgi:hypothetical protein